MLPQKSNYSPPDDPADPEAAALEQLELHGASQAELVEKARDFASKNLLKGVIRQGDGTTV